MQRMALKVVVIAFLIIFISTSLSAQTTEPPQLDIEHYTTPIEALNAYVLDRVALLRLADYVSVDHYAIDSSGRVVAAEGFGSDYDEPWITVWNADTHDTYRFDIADGIEGVGSAHSRVAVSPDGSKLAAAGWSDNHGIVRMWDISTGDALLTEVVESYAGYDVLEFSPDGRYLVAAEVTSPGNITWWDVATGVRVNSISYPDYDLMRTEFDREPPGHVRDVFITSDNRMYFGHGGTIFEWNLETNALGPVYAMRDAVRIPGAPADAARRGYHTYPELDIDDLIWSVAVSPDGRYIATGHHRSGARVWDTQHPAWAMPYEAWEDEDWDEAITQLALDVFSHGSVPWLQFNPTGDALIAVDNNSLFALSTGSWDMRAQYDFRNAVILSAALNVPATMLFVGDVEFGGIAVLAVSAEATPQALPTATPVPLTFDPNATGPCLIEITALTYIYSMPNAALGNYYDLGAGVQLIPSGRLADNSWLRTDYAGAWIETSAFGSTATMSGDCSELPILTP